MRIAMISPLELRVPPVKYGGIELVVSLLTEELVKRGHDVTLFASGDSITRAKLASVCPTFVRGSGRNADILDVLNTVSCLERADDFDIIHTHAVLAGLSMAGLVSTPMLTSLHGGLAGDFLLLFQHYTGWHSTISQSQKALLPPKERFAGVIYNAIDCSSYPFNEGAREDVLLFLSRMSAEKGPHMAIEVARSLKMPLRLAGGVHPVDKEYFYTQVLPHVDGHRVQYLGEVDFQTKCRLLSRSRCLLAPITWPEPFGLFIIEAMACGTPVVALNQGAAPEIVRHGVTGFVGDTVADMREGVRRIGEIAPRSCREHVEQHFDVPRMVDDYLAAYERVLRAEPPAAMIRRTRPARTDVPFGARASLVRGKSSQRSGKVPIPVPRPTR